MKLYLFTIKTKTGTIQKSVKCTPSEALKLAGHYASTTRGEVFYRAW